MVVCLIAASLGVASTPAGAAQPGACTPMWELAFEDNFEGDEVDTDAWGMYNSPGHAGNGLRRPSAFSVADGLLTVTADMQGGQVVSGGMATLEARTYGRFEARVRTDADPSLTMSGVVIAWPLEQGDENGGYTELNMYETGTSKRTPLDFWVHYDVPNKPDRPHFTAPVDATEWHDVRMEWTETEVAFYLDGVFVDRTTRPEVIPRADHKMTVQLDAFAPTIGEEPVHMQVDWVRISDYNAAGTAECLGDVPGADGAVEVAHTTSCLSGNGRIDTNIVNTGNDAAAYRIQFEGLSPRQSTVAAGDWWRMPITGRADDSYRVVVRRDGVVVSDQHVLVKCDDPAAMVTNNEIQVVNACRAGNGYLLFQFANQLAVVRSYIIEFTGVDNRSTSAAAGGGTVRAVTGRQSGSYAVHIRSGDDTIARFVVEVSCV